MNLPITSALGGHTKAPFGEVQIHVNKVVRIKPSAFSEAAEAKLLSSGISIEQAERLGMYSVNNAMQLDECFESQPALVIPYFDTHGKPLRAHKSQPDFYRVRYLGESTVKSFELVAGDKPSRYAQPINSGVCAYFPQLTNWERLRADPTEPLLITEGELKAAKATMEGFPTIGLGGVHNFKATPKGLFFLPELEAFKWARRRTTIVYDSDYLSKPGICAAINSLADELDERGAIVHIATLEDVYEEEDKKTGLDDFLVARSDEELIRILAQADHIGITKHLWKMNTELAYVRDPGMVVVAKTAQKLDCSKFTAHSDWATQSVPERVLKPNGDLHYQKTAAAPVWIRWPMRNAVDKLTYLPGEPPLVERDGLVYLNQWRSWGAKPVKGNVAPFLELVDHLFTDTEKEAKQWFLDWCAYPIQFPGTKLFSAAIVHGRMTGTGKTLIGYTLARIYGQNFIKIKSADLQDTWWAENRQFVLGDEITGSDKRAEADMMKAMVTQEEVNINIKYIPQFSIPDCVNYYLTSNHADALFLEDEDRRFFVHEVTVEPLDDEFYKRYDKWLKKEGGANFLMQWFLDRKLDNFNPKAPAFKTKARERMILSGKSDLDTWLVELKESPSSKLRVGQLKHQRDLFTAKEILAMYEIEHERQAGKVGANGMSRALSRAGYKQIMNGTPLSYPDGRQGRFFAIRNSARWLSTKDRKALMKNISLQPVKD